MCDRGIGEDNNNQVMKLQQQGTSSHRDKDRKHESNFLKFFVEIINHQFAITAEFEKKC